jgi:hypothetical protein
MDLLDREKVTLNLGASVRRSDLKPRRRMAEYPKVATITLHTVPRCYLLGSARPIDFNVSLKRESNTSALVPIRKSSIAVQASPLEFPVLLRASTLFLLA